MSKIDQILYHCLTWPGPEYVTFAFPNEGQPLVMFPNRTPLAVWDRRHEKQHNVNDDPVVDIFKRLGERFLQASGI